MCHDMGIIMSKKLLSIEEIYNAMETVCGATEKEPLPYTLEEFKTQDFYKDFIAFVREIERLHGVKL